MKLIKAAIILTILVFHSDFSNCSCITDGENCGYDDVTIDSVSDAIAQFTLKQYKEMVNDTMYDNILTSPYSIWSALAFTYLGARGESSADLGTLLGLRGMSKIKVEDKLRELSVRVSSNSGNILTVANKIAVEQTLQVKNCTVNDSFVPLDEANFQFNPDGERIMLNNWVESKTCSDCYISA